MSQKVLITGANGGFGKLTVQALLNQGHTVVASMRGVEGKNQGSAQELTDLGAYVVEIDVTDELSVNKGIERAIELTGGLDVVVNNAGIGVLGMVEHFTTDDFQKLFEVNVFGVQRINRAVLPYFRKQQSGLIIYVSSLLGRITLPFYGPYNATKWALEAIAENYRAELSGFGIDNCIVEPGGFPTSFFESLIQPGDQSRSEAYGELMNAPKQMFESFEGALNANPEQKPQLVADAITNLINTDVGSRAFRTTVDLMGMGDAVKSLNGQSEEITKGMYSNFGIEGMLKVAVPA